MKASQCWNQLQIYKQQCRQDDVAAMYAGVIYNSSVRRSVRNAYKDTAKGWSAGAFSLWTQRKTVRWK